MRKKLNHELIKKLVNEGKSYKEIINITGYNKSSVHGYCWKTFGKMQDKNKFRRQSIPISQEQKEILFGMMMGDGHIQKVINSYQGRINHSIKQLEYCRYNRSLIENLTYDVKFNSTTNKLYPGKIYEKCYFCFKPNENLKEIHDLFYYNKKKDVPLDLSLLTPRAMAIWFMDDGTATGKCTISIATCSFSINGLIRLKNYLYEKYNIEVIINKDFKLYFKAESGRRFFHLIKNYMIEPMMYKFKYVNTSADLKQGELLGYPLIEDNQQPSLNSNVLEGSETNSQIPLDNSKDSNADTSALPL